MKYMSTAKIGLVFLLGALLSFSCNGKTTTRTKPTNFQFTINGVLVKDRISSKDIAYFTILRDSVLFNGALVKVGADTIKSQGNGVYQKKATSLFNYGQNVLISISSIQDNFIMSTSILIPGSFQITSLNHSSIISGQTNDVTMNFSLSSNASGYFKSIIRPDGSNGYTHVIDAQEYGLTPIPADAFDIPVYKTGTYKIYLVAYRSSFLNYSGMPFFLPIGLPVNNISGANGTIGAGVIAPLDSVKAE